MITGSTASSQNINFAAINNRYDGLIDIPISEKIFKSFIAFFNYCDIFVPKMPAFYSLMSILRLFQLIGASFFEANSFIYKKGTLSYNTISIISILFHIIPTQYRDANAYILLIILTSIMIILAISLIISTAVYMKTSKVPKTAAVIIYIMVSILAFYFPPLVAHYLGIMISGFITKAQAAKTSLICLIIVTIIVSYLYMASFYNSFSKTLVFRPTSFLTLEGRPQEFLFFGSIFVNLFAGLATYFSKWATFAMIILSAIAYFICIFSVFGYGTFIDINHQIFVISGSIVGVITCLLNLVPLFMNKTWNEYFFAMYFGIAFVVFLTFSFILRNRVNKDLKILDDIQETQDITLISKRKFKQILVSGYTNCHSICTDFTIFKLATNEWHDDVSIWMLFAKFTAIYPDLNHQLMFIAETLTSFNMNDELRKVIIMNIDNITKTREAALTSQLKSKLSKLNKQFNKTKNKLRNVWDLVLQGNLNEVNSAVKTSLTNIEECDKELSHLMRQYPNNKYVYRQYITFLQDINGDILMAKNANLVLNKMQRGIRVNTDFIHDLGIAAMPNIPVSCKDASFIAEQIQQNNNDEFNDSINKIFSDEDTNLDKYEMILKSINKHKIPAINFIYYSTFALWFILIFLPLLILILLFNYYVKAVKEPIAMFQGFSYVRNILTMVPTMMQTYIMTKLDDPKNHSKKLMKPLELCPKFESQGYDGEKDNLGILQHMISIVEYCITFLDGVRTYKEGNKRMDQMREYTYGKNINFTQYFNPENTSQLQLNVEDSLFLLSVKCSSLLEYDNYTYDIIENGEFLTAMNNYYLPIYNLNNASNLLAQEVKDTNRKHITYFKIALVVLSAINVIAIPIVYTVQYKKLMFNKKQILQSFTTLPKTVLSTISSSYNTIKGSDSDQKFSVQEINRQEETIIKLFSSISDSKSTGASIEFSNFLSLFLILILVIISFAISYKSFRNTALVMINNCSQLDYLFGIAAYLYGIVGSLFKFGFANYDPIFNKYIVNKEMDFTGINLILPLLIKSINTVLIGGKSGNNELPFPNLKTVITNAQRFLTCPLIDSQYKSLMDSVHCFTLSDQLFIVASFVKRYTAFIENDSDPLYIDVSSDFARDIWQVGPIEIYESIPYQGGQRYVTEIQAQIDNEKMEMIKCSSIIIVVTFVIMIYIMLVTKREDKLMKFYFTLLLKVPADTLLGNQRLMDLINGDYSINDQSNLEKYTKISDEIFNSINDIIIVIEEQTGKIVAVNHAFEGLFNLNSEDVVKRHVSEFFNEDRFKTSEKVEDVFKKQITLISYCSRSKSDAYINFSSIFVGSNRILFGRDQTQNYIHEKLIEDEKKKSDAMLASILPPMLVPKVQAGEKNISFACQSATILFLDVVEFTPWCGSHDAQYVMRMLNIMFKEFDIITNAHKTMTKIKCIGDCYMAAGGIFDEVNQPPVHAKEVVDFGCKVIKKLLEIDELENEKLRIRVGINTGGPIVAGVIGTEKPTFEILGPAINISHEMESHGIPMKVHISRSVYELIYGQNFDIRERGEIDVKKGKMFTYIVEP